MILKNEPKKGKTAQNLMDLRSAPLFSYYEKFYLARYISIARYVAISRYSKVIVHLLR